MSGPSLFVFGSFWVEKEDHYQFVESPEILRKLPRNRPMTEGCPQNQGQVLYAHHQVPGLPENARGAAAGNLDIA